MKCHIKEMDNVNFIGCGFSGHWEIHKEGKKSNLISKKSLHHFHDDV